MAALVVLLWLGDVAGVCAKGLPFITKWQGKAGEELRIPIVGEYTLTWYNAKSPDERHTEQVKVARKIDFHNNKIDPYRLTPSEDGVYVVEAGPEGVLYMRMEYEGSSWDMQMLGSSESLLEVVQFGAVEWVSMRQMFLNCSKMTFATGIDRPNLAKVIDMEDMFYKCSSFNSPLEKWDMSHVQNLSGMFVNCTLFNQPLEKWDMSKVAGYYGLNFILSGCLSFDQPLGTWKIRSFIRLEETGLSPENYSKTLVGWASQPAHAKEVDIYADGLRYNSAGKAAREKLIASGWTFHGDFYEGAQKVAITLAHEGKGTVEVAKYDEQALKAVPIGARLGVQVKAANGYTITSLTAGTEDILDFEDKGYPDTYYFTVSSPVEVKAVFTKDEELPTMPVRLEQEGEGTFFLRGPYYDNICDAEALQAIPLGTSLYADAKPAEGYTLTSLTLDVEPNPFVNGVRWFVVRKPVTVKAVFTKNSDLPKAEVTLVKEGKGTLSVAGYNSQTLKAVPVGTEITVVATPAVDYTLTSLIQDDLFIDRRWEILVSGDTEIKAIFVKKTEAQQVGVSLAKEGEGMLSLEGYPAATFQAVPLGAEVTVKTHAGDDYMLTKLLANGKDILATKRFFATEFVEIQAVFTKKADVPKVAITLAKEGKGTLTIAGYDDQALLAVPVGSELTVVATPDEEYTNTSLVAGSEDILVSKKFVVTKAVEVKAIFKKKTDAPKFAVTLAYVGRGTLMVKGYSTEALNAVPLGTNLTVDAIPVSGYKLTSLTANGVDIRATKKFTVTAATTVTAVFEKEGEDEPVPQPKTFKVTLTQGEHGTISIEGKDAAALEAVAENTELTVIATPEDDTYELKELKAGGVDILATKKFTVTAATTVTAVFGKKGNAPDPQPKTFKVTLTQGEHGTITIKDHTDAQLAAVAEGTELTVVDKPDDGYQLKELKAGGVDILATKKFTVTAATEVTAVFGKKGETPDPQPKTFKVTLTQPEHGTISIEGKDAAALEAVAENTELTVIATPEDDTYELKELKAGGVDILATKKFTVTAATEVTAVFGKKGETPAPPQAVEDALLVALTVTPNLFSTHLRLKNPEGVSVAYELVNLTGVVVRAGLLDAREVIVDTADLSAGLYLVRLMGQNGAEKSLKVIKH